MKTVKIIPKGEGKKVDLPGGSWSLQMVTKDTVGSEKSMIGISTFKPGTRGDQMVHEEEEMCYVLSGKGKIEVDDQAVECKAGDAIYIAPGVPHGVYNPEKEDLVMVFAFSSSEYPPTSKCS